MTTAVRKGNIHHHRMPPLFQTCILIVDHKIILLILVVLDIQDALHTEILRNRRRLLLNRK